MQCNFSGYIKYVSLVVLTVQNAALGLSMRYARTRKVDEMFSSPAGELYFIHVYNIIFTYFTVYFIYQYHSFQKVIKLQYFDLMMGFYYLFIIL